MTLLLSLYTINMDSEEGWTQVITKKKQKPLPATPAKLNPSIPSTQRQVTSPNNNTQDKKFNSGKNVQAPHSNARKIEKDANSEDIITTPKLTHNFTIQMQQTRQQNGLTQKQLANLCQLPEATIKSYENGSALPNPQDISKINKALGVTIKNK